MGWNRELRPEDGGLEYGVVILEGHIGIDASGGVSTAYTRFRGGSCSRTGTGAYTLTLTHQFFKIISVQLSLKRASAGQDIYLEPGDVAGNAGVAAGTTVKFTTRKLSDRSAVDNDGGEATVYVSIKGTRSGLTR